MHCELSLTFGSKYKNQCNRTSTIIGLVYVLDYPQWSSGPLTSLSFSCFILIEVIQPVATSLSRDDLISSHLAKFMPRDLIPSVLSWDPNYVVLSLKVVTFVVFCQVL